MLELSLLEKDPQFILDTNVLNKLALPLVDIFSFYCPEGVIEEHERWLSSLEKMPTRIENLEKEITTILEPVKQTKDYVSLLEGVKNSAEYGEVSKIVERAFIERKLDEFRNMGIEQWDKQIEAEYGKTQDFEREKRNHYLELAKAIFYDVLHNHREVRIERKVEDEKLEEMERLLKEYYKEDEELDSILNFRHVLRLTPNVYLAREADTVVVTTGKEQSTSTVPFYPYGYLKRREIKAERKNKELEQLQARYAQLKGEEGELENAKAVIQKVKDQGRIIPRRNDELMRILESYTSLLSKSITSDVIKKCAWNIARSEKNIDVLVEEGMKLYRERYNSLKQTRQNRGVEETHESEMKAKIERHISSLVKQIDEQRYGRVISQTEINEIAEEYQSWTNLKVDAEVLRAGMQKKEESKKRFYIKKEIYIVTNDSDVEELGWLFTYLGLKKGLGGEHFLEYVDVNQMNDFYERIRGVHEKLQKHIPL